MHVHVDEDVEFGAVLLQRNHVSFFGIQLFILNELQSLLVALNDGLLSGFGECKCVPLNSLALVIEVELPDALPVGVLLSVPK